jgi:hypothetical protein
MDTGSQRRRVSAEPTLYFVSLCMLTHLSLSAIAFAVHLHVDHEYALDVAYATSVSQFRDLRATHSQMIQFARLEAEAYGAVWKGGEIGRGVAVEDRYLSSWWGGSPDAADAGEDTQITQKGRTLTRPVAVDDPFDGGLLYLRGQDDPSVVRAAAASKVGLGDGEGLVELGQEEAAVVLGEGEVQGRSAQGEDDGLDIDFLKVGKKSPVGGPRGAGAGRPPWN